jgi:hypothetical protein
MCRHDFLGDPLERAKVIKLPKSSETQLRPFQLQVQCRHCIPHPDFFFTVLPLSRNDVVQGDNARRADRAL